jgi:methyl-accepting chemotaxis protein-1 (serine sensor receptor)
VTDIMGEIAAASEEQSSGIEQVARAVTQMDEVTQQNAALVEEAAAAAQSLEDQASKLRQAVAVFQLDERGVVVGNPARAVAGSVAVKRPKVSSAIAARVAPVVRAPLVRPAAVVVASGPASASNSGDWETF